MIVCHLAAQSDKAIRTQHASHYTKVSPPIETGLPVAKWITGPYMTHIYPFIIPRDQGC